MAAKPSPEEVWDALNELRRALNDAYWEVKVIDEKSADRLLALAQDIDSIQDDMDRDEIISNTAEYKKLKSRVNGVNDKLNQLKDDIDGLIHKVETTTKIVGFIEKAVNLAAKFFV